MLRRVGLGLLVAAGLGNVAAAQGPAGFDGQYVGQLTLTQILAGDCSQPPLGAVYPLLISRGEVRFAYVPRFDTTLTGRVDRNGTFKATARTRAGLVRMTGRIVGGTVTASIVSRSCAYSFQTRP